MTFKAQNWGDILIASFVTVGGIGFMTGTSPGAIAFGVGLFLVGLSLLVAFLGSRIAVVSVAGVTVRRLFRWAKTYGIDDLAGATYDVRWSPYPRSMPQLTMKDGTTAMLWSMGEAGWAQHPTTDAFVLAVNQQLAFSPDRPASQS